MDMSIKKPDLCIFVSFPCGILGQLWYSIVSFLDLCRLPYSDYGKHIAWNPQIGFQGPLKFIRGDLLTKLIYQSMRGLTLFGL